MPLPYAWLTWGLVPQHPSQHCHWRWTAGKLLVLERTDSFHGTGLPTCCHGFRGGHKAPLWSGSLTFWLAHPSCWGVAFTLSRG